MMEEYRRQIDALDAQLLALFEERMQVARKVGMYKKERGLAVFDPAREEQLLAAKIALLQDDSLSSAADALFRVLMNLSKAEQKKIIGPAKGKAAPQNGKAAYQGIPGAYGEQAAAACFKGGELVACQSFDDVFDLVSRGGAAYGVLPIENSTAGSVREVYDLLSTNNCHIVAEHMLRIEHCLLAKPGVALEDIKEVYSHQQSLWQCIPFLKPYEQHAVVNNAIAAKFVLESGRTDIAAVASRHAANLYGLDILAERINTRADNTTRFVVISQSPSSISGQGKLSLSFVTRHEPGMLGAVLSVFAERNLNLSRLESRNLPGWHYRFYADIECALNEQQTQELLEYLAPHTMECRLLGRYGEIA